MTYVRVDWDNGYYEYLPNDIDCGDGEFRNSFLLNNNMYYHRIRFMPQLPPGKKCTIYRTNNKNQIIREVDKNVDD